jgi:thiamine biosynthesis lipoprotein
MPGSNCRARTTTESRRGLLRAAALLLAAPWLPACSPPAAVESTELLVFGSPAEISLRGLDPARQRQAMAALSQLFSALEADWHPWRDSGLTRFNAACAAGLPAALPTSLRPLLERSRALAEASEGLFDPAIGGLVRLWGFHSSDYPLRSPPPDAAAINAWRNSAPSLRQLIERGDGRFECSNRALQLDFNAIAEGAALVRAGAVLDRLRIRHALLNLGGDVLALGDAGARPWRVGLRDPAGGVLASLALGDRDCLFSSGGYAKYREQDGQRWPHLLDPRSGRPVQDSLASAVLDRDCQLADAAATALMVAGPRGFARLVQRLRLRHALLLDADDVLHLTAPMQARIALRRAPGKIEVYPAPATADAAGPAAVPAGGSRSPARSRP